MPETPTTGELFKAKAILDEEINAAVDAFMRDATTDLFVITKGYRLDLAAAVKASKFARDELANPETTEHRKRAAVRTAILLARPVKG